MPVSDRKRAANQANSHKSTGPRNTEKVALNALKHGLRSQQLVLPGEDPAAFDAMLAAGRADWTPCPAAGRVLVERAVPHAWRPRRCLRAEHASLVGRGRAAVGARRAGSFAEV